MNDECLKAFSVWRRIFRTDDETWFGIQYNILEIPKCGICGNFAKFTGSRKSKILGYNTVCEKCSANQLSSKKETFKNTISKRSVAERKSIFEKRKKTNKEKYNDENYTLFGSTSFKQTLLNKYDDINYNNSSQISLSLKNKNIDEKNEAIEKSRQTKLKKYNNVNFNNRDKYKETCLERYNSTSANIPEIIAKQQNTKRKHIETFENENDCILLCKLVHKYGQCVYNVELQRVINNHNVYIKNADIEKIEKYIQRDRIPNYTSLPEKELYDILSGWNLDVLRNVNGIVQANNRMYELDLYIPSKHIAIEFNGTYWHSTKFKDKWYHQRKRLACEQNGIRLINIFEYIWHLKKDIILSELKALFFPLEKIHARKCIIKPLESVTCRNFLNANHIQGYVASKCALGLFYKDELLQCITVGKSRFNKNENELLRMCTKQGYRVNGGFSKLISHLPKEYFPLVSYVDLDFHNGHGYDLIGFKYVHDTAPNYVYVKGDDIKTRYQAQKHKLHTFLQFFDKNLTEEENMLLNKYCKIYNSGSKKFIKYE